MPHTYVLREKWFSLGGSLWIADEAGNSVYEVDGKAFSVRRTLDLRDAAGNVLYRVQQPMMRFRPTFEIKRGDEVVAVVEKALLSFLGDRFKVSLAGGRELVVRGDWIDRTFRVLDESGAEVVNASRKLVSLRDSYGIQVAPTFDVPLALAIVIALEQLEDEEHHRD